MQRAVTLALGTMLCAAPLAAPALVMAADAKAKPAASAKAGAYKAPRTSFGQPDLGDNWSNASLTPENRPAGLGERLVYTPDEVKQVEGKAATELEVDNRNLDPNAPAPSVGGDLRPGQTQFSAAGGNVGGYNRGWLDPGSVVMRVRGEPRTSLITTPTGRAPPRKAGAPAQAAGGIPRPGGGAPMGAFDNPEQRSAGERCLISFGRNGGPPMFANGFYNNNYHFVQTKDHVAIEVEMVHDVRMIRLNSKHRTDGVRPWFGDSIGWWEGDTLVVETTNIPQRQAYNGSWQNLTVTEKFTRTGADRLHYEFVINDPTLWDKPWGGEYEFSRLDGQVYEYACHEGNYALEGMLAGARQEDAQRAAQAKK